jgi:hypothetical protein
MLMFTIVLMGLTLSAVAQQWKTMVQRELEADLLAKGLEIQNALALYSATMKSGRGISGEIYPAALVDLTKQPRPALRKVYLDPVGHREWELVRHPNGGIMGVRSTSKDKPIKKREFPTAVRHFENLPTYHDWVFQFPNVSTASGAPLLGFQPGAPAVPAQSATASGNPGQPPTPPEGLLEPVAPLP